MYFVCTLFACFYKIKPNQVQSEHSAITASPSIAHTVFKGNSNMYITGEFVYIIPVVVCIALWLCTVNLSAVYAYACVLCQWQNEYGLYYKWRQTFEFPSSGVNMSVYIRVETRNCKMVLDLPFSRKFWDGNINGLPACVQLVLSWRET